MTDFTSIPTDEVIEKTISSLEANGIHAVVVSTKEEAKAKALELIPEKSEVMTMSSVTLDEVGLTQEINESGKFDAVKPKLSAMDRQTQGREMQKIGSAPDFTIGSAHAVTQDGHILIASNTGSQLPAYAYGAGHVIWVIGAQKIVENFDAGTKRIYDYILPLESKRLAKVYNKPDLKSYVSKLLVINREIVPGRATIIFVKEVLGF